MRAQARTLPPPCLTLLVYGLGHQLSFSTLWSFITLVEFDLGSSLYFFANSCPFCLQLFTVDEWFAPSDMASYIFALLQMVDCGSFTPALWRLLAMLLTFCWVFLYSSYHFCHQVLLFSWANRFDVWYVGTAVLSFFIWMVQIVLLAMPSACAMWLIFPPVSVSKMPWCSPTNRWRDQTFFFFSGTKNAIYAGNTQVSKPRIENQM